MGVCGAVVVVAVVSEGVKRVWVEESGSGSGGIWGCEGESGERESEPGVGGRERCVRLVVVICTAGAGEGIFA